MSKSKGNIFYTDTLLDQGYDRDQIRFFLIYGHYRKKLNYSDQAMRLTADQLNAFKERIRALKGRVGRNSDTPVDENTTTKIRELFTGRMDEDLDVKGAFDGLYDLITPMNIRDLTPSTASGYLKALKEIDQVLQVLF